MTAGRSSFIYALIYVLAPVIAKFYGNPELVALARVVSLSIIFDGADQSAGVYRHEEHEVLEVGRGEQWWRRSWR